MQFSILEYGDYKNLIPVFETPVPGKVNSVIPGKLNPEIPGLNNCDIKNLKTA